MGNDASKVKKFRYGWKSGLRGRRAAYELRSYTVVIQKAMIIEGESDMSQKERPVRKRKLGGTERNQDLEEQRSFQNKKRFRHQQSENKELY